MHVHVHVSPGHGTNTCTCTCSLVRHDREVKKKICCYRHKIRTIWTNFAVKLNFQIKNSTNETLDIIPFQLNRLPFCADAHNAICFTYKTYHSKQSTDRNVELYPQFFLELITTQLRFHMVSPQLVLLVLTTVKVHHQNRLSDRGPGGFCFIVLPFAGNGEVHFHRDIASVLGIDINN